MQIALDGLAPERHLQLLERHLEQPARLAVRHVAKQLGLIRQLVILQMGIAGDGVVTHRLEQVLQGAGRVTLGHQLAPLIEVAASQLAPLVDPVAGHIALDGIQIALVTALPLPHGDTGKGLLHFDRVGPLPGPGRPAQQAVPVGREGAVDKALGQGAVLLFYRTGVGYLGGLQYLFDPGE
ncbi:hypothetical protein D3C79_642380 [compost metagenome]